MHHKRRLFSLVIFVLLFTLASVSVQAQTPIPEDLLTDFEQVIQDEMAYFGIPGVAVAVIMGDEVVYAQGFGLRDIAADAPFTTETQFRIGSTTKSMTSLLIAQLVDEGLLSWDTPVTDIFPEFQTADPELTAQITVRDLMGMGTGLVSATLDGLYWGDWEVDDIFNAVTAMEIGGDYGEFYSYNNEVYALAGYAGVVAGGLEPTLDNYTMLMQQRVFDPIGMDSAIITDDLTLLSDNYSESYELSLLDGEPALMGSPPLNVVAPAGAVWTNIEDMSRYVLTQMNGGVTPDGTRIVSEANLMETWLPGVAIDSGVEGIEDTAYAMGWVTQSYEGVEIRYHDGGWVGYSTQMMILPEDDTALIVFANASQGALFGSALIYRFVELLHDLEPHAVETTHELWDQTLSQFEQARTVISTEIGDVSDFIGEYENGWVIEQREDDSLWLLRGAWHFQLGYIEMLDQYIVLNNGAAGTLISFETDDETETITLVIQLGLGDEIRLEKVG